MIYEIRSNSDLLSGETLIVKIPEQDLDRKALYTLKEDKPDFILPFCCRSVNGHIELAYKVGAQSKLHYLAGERHPKEYAELWSSALSPLLECGDWFLRPYSFVLDIKHLYCDKNNNSVCYVYIPSKKNCSDYYCLKEMAVGFSRQVTVTDGELENKVLRAIMMDFNPKTFLQMLKTALAASAPAVYAPIEAHRSIHEQNALTEPEYPEQAISEPEEFAFLQQSELQPQMVAQDDSEEIKIDIPTDRKAAKNEKESKKDKGAPREKKEKQPKNRESDNKMQKNKMVEYREKILKTDTAQQSRAPATPKPHQGRVHHAVPAYGQPAGAVSITQNLSHEISGAWLRLVGSASLPKAIDVEIAEGEIFTVGRYDTAVGKKQSSFEFEKMTKAVSRRHAAIERRTDGYSLIDLSSSAGTFLNGQKLPPNTTCKLQPGCRVSFGNCGADYVWEQ